MSSCRLDRSGVDFRRKSRSKANRRIHAISGEWWNFWERTRNVGLEGFKRRKKKEELLRMIEGTNRGVVNERKEEILQCAKELSEMSERTGNTSDEKLTATWKLLWTTEKETLFILGKFKSGEAYQVIDVDAGTLQNVIEFRPSGRFVVDAKTKVVSDSKVEFKFEKARIDTRFGSLPLPPFGSGWFENIYVDDTLRLSWDSRGDILVVQRL